MTRPIVNVADLELVETTRGSRFARKAGRIGGVIGSRQLGAQYYVVPPGKSAVPYHSHRTNEEMYVVLEGRAPIATACYEVKAGDVLAALAGDASTAHQLTIPGG